MFEKEEINLNLLTYNMRIPGWKRTHEIGEVADEPKSEWQSTVELI